jgi:hypothetical protein
VWITTAWQCIATEVTVKGFNKCCISNVVDMTDGDMLWDVRGECEGDEGTVKVETVTLIGNGI